MTQTYANYWYPLRTFISFLPWPPVSIYHKKIAVSLSRNFTLNPLSMFDQCFSFYGCIYLDAVDYRNTGLCDYR